MSIKHGFGKIRAFIHTREDRDDIQSLAGSDDRASLTAVFGSPHVTDCIDAVLRAMADRAMRAWPHWYGGDAFADAPSRSLDDRLHSFLVALELCRRNREVEPAWLKKATHLAVSGKPPLTPGLVAEVQVRQLALALNIDEILLVAPDSLCEARDCGGIARAVEWLAGESGLDVTVLLPAEMASNPDLAPLLYNAEHWAEYRQRNREGNRDGRAEASVDVPPRTAASPFPSHIPDEDAPEAERVVGVPHPKSLGEQLLAKRLPSDPQLAGLFGHNQPVTTRCGRRFLVDLLWPEGKVVVEIDGYEHHKDEIVFTSDRDRDYRLLISGYRVLRLTHSDVVRDVGLALEKIRDVVNFVQQGSEANNVR